MSSIDLRDLQLQDMADLLEDEGEPRFRAKQMCQWLYKHQATDLEQMTNVPESLRQRLQTRCHVGGLSVLRHQTSDDGTEKILFGLADGKQIETVLIPAEERRTLCVSTQVGCCDWLPVLSDHPRRPGAEFAAVGNYQSSAAFSGAWQGARPRV